MHRQPILTERTVAAWDFLALPEGVAQMWGKTVSQWSLLRDAPEAPTWETFLGSGVLMAPGCPSPGVRPPGDGSLVPIWQL